MHSGNHLCAQGTHPRPNPSLTTAQLPADSSGESTASRPHAGLPGGLSGLAVGPGMWAVGRERVRGRGSGWGGWGAPEPAGRAQRLSSRLGSCCVTSTGRGRHQRNASVKWASLHVPRTVRLGEARFAE